MKILIAGGTGFVGSAIANEFIYSGHYVSVIGNKAENNSPAIMIKADTTKPGDWQKKISDNDIIINLTGTSIFTRWTGKRRKEIIQSRLLTTRNIVSAISSSKKKRRILINASAAGYYGFHGDEILDENNSPGNDFLAELASAWEREAEKASLYNTRVAVCRFGVVLGKNGGAFPEMRRFFNICLGAQYGSGRQWFSWIHLDDLVKAVYFIAIHKTLNGAFNCTAPAPVTNRELALTLAEILKRPLLFRRVPEFVLKLLLGKFSNTLVKGQKVIPKKLIEAGFNFKFQSIREALIDLTA